MISSGKSLARLFSSRPPEMLTRNARSRLTSVSDIPTWAEVLQSSRGDSLGNARDDETGSQESANDEVQSASPSSLNDKISVWQGDITKLIVDAIVNAANKTLLGGGGVDGAIHAAAGPELYDECEKLNGCPTGEAKITGAYRLPCKAIIHTVGPRGMQPDRLQACYLNSLELMAKHKLRSVAFPCISTGIYGFPNEPACKLACQTVRDWLEHGNNITLVDRVIFCVFLKPDVVLYKKYMPIYFPSVAATSQKRTPTKESTNMDVT